MMKYLSILLLFSFSFSVSYAQKAKFDSLYQVAVNAESDADKSFYFDEASRAILRYNPDSSLIVAMLGLDYAKKTGNDTLISDSYNSLGTIYKALSNYPKAISSLKTAIKHGEKVNALRQIENANSSLGLVYLEQGNFSASIEVQYKILLSAKNREDTFSIAQTLNNIANCYFEQNLYDKALENYQNAYEYAVIMNSEFGQCLLLGNIGACYYKKKEYDKAMENYQKSYEISVRIEDMEGVGIMYGSFASVYFGKKEFDKALEFQLKALEVKQQLNDKHGESVSLNEVGKIHDELGDVNKGIFYSKGALNIAIEIGAKELERDANEALYKMFEKKGDKVQAYKYFRNHIELRDSLINEETKKKDIRNELNFQFQKQHFADSLEQVKKDEIAQQTIEKERVKADAQKKLTYVFSIAFIVMLILAGFIFKEYKAKKRSHEIIAQQKQEVEEQSHIISEKNKEITDSINYAKSIQTALLTEDAEWDKISKEHFVFLKPKDVVSGDFFWAFNDDEQNIAIWTAADCTGHGVPGAFMSMLGIGFLNEIVIESKITEPSQILNLLRDKIIKALSQKNVDTQKRDGIDMALCVWDKNKNELFYSGANNPLWIINPNRKEWPQEAIQFGEGLSGAEIKPDKQPVGFYTGDIAPFNSIKIKLEKEDQIYVFSDGYADQFGGEKGKKLKYKPFKEMLLKISSLKMNQQKEELASFFEQWKGDLEQLDDVCVIGVKV